MKRQVRKSEQGFTLVELAIVLVIIGLIVGGVLVGQDLIKAAEIRSAISDFERYNSAVNTFRTKYTGIPGDLLSTRATAFGLQARTGADGRGDGDGMVEGLNAAAPAVGRLNHETALFWRDLSDATMISQTFSTATDASAAVAAAAMPTYLPSLRVRTIAFVHVYGTGGRNFYQISDVTAVAADGSMTIAAGLTPLEALQFDQKVDDGGTITGTAVAITATNTPAITTTNDACVDGTVAGDPYNTLTQAEQDTIGCMLRIRAQF